MGSVIWNQLEPPLTADNYKAYDTSYTTVSFDNGIATQTWVAQMMGYSASICRKTNADPAWVADHIYYCSYMFNPSISAKAGFSIEWCSGEVATGKLSVANQWQRYSARQACSSTTAKGVYIANFRGTSGATSVGMTCKVKSFIVVDLTQMFGAGNEPTLEDFEYQCKINGIDLQEYQEMDTTGTEREWIFYKSKQTYEISGENIFFSTPCYTPFDEFKIIFKPRQSGSGTPSESNIRNFVGYNTLSLIHCGKNIIYDKTVYNRWITTNNTWNWAISNDSTSIAIAVKPNTTYTLSGYISGGTIYRLALINIKTLPSLTDQTSFACTTLIRATSYDTFGTTRTFTTLADTTYAVIQVNKTMIDDQIAAIQCEVGDIAHSYEANHMENITINLPETFYGGYLDLVSGELVQTHDLCVMDGVTDGKKFSSKGSGTSSNNYYWNFNKCSIFNFDGSTTGWVSSTVAESYGFKSNYYAVQDTSSQTVPYCGVYIGSSGTWAQPRIVWEYSTTELDTVEKANAWLKAKYDAGMPYCFSYPLRYPLIYKINPTIIRVFQGANNFWTNDDGVSFDVKYLVRDSMEITKAKHRIATNYPAIKTAAAASMAHFSTDMIAPLKKCLLNSNAVSSSETLLCCGKNLFDKVNAQLVNLYIRDDNGIVTSDSVQCYTSTVTRVKPNTMYTLSGFAENNGSNAKRVYFLQSDETWISRTNGFYYQPYTFITPANCYYLQFQFSYVETLATVQLEEGNAVTAYESYTSNTGTIDTLKTRYGVNNIYAINSFNDIQVNYWLHKPITVLPKEYQLVEYLSRTSSADGPYCNINISVAANDIIACQMTVDNPNKKEMGYGFYNSTPKLEVYYQSSTNSIKAWSDTTGLISYQASTKGSPDLLLVKIGADYTLVRWGAYNTTWYQFNGNLYKLTTTHNGEISHQLLPCVRKSDNEPGFYDTITNIFYTNVANTGTWVPGNNLD